MSNFGLKLSREQVYIISSIVYYGYAAITKDLKSKLWLDALDLEDTGYIKKKNTHFSSVIFIGTDKIYDLQLEFKNKRVPK
jgi:hypothetical protein